MKIVIAPDSFKESLTALAVATAIEAGFKEIFPNYNYLKIPVADGGEGTVDAMISATCGTKITSQVTDPLGNKISAIWGLLGDKTCAVIEMAASSGLQHVPQHLRNPMITTSFGTGELILAALDANVRQIIIGIGGSATNDGGMGMLQALGAKFQDKNGQLLGLGCGENLKHIHHIDLSNLDKRLHTTEILVACDVNNPLCGVNGASYVFGTQKGATSQMIQTLDDALLNFGKLIEQIAKREIINVKGTGAAGGLGASLLGLLNAKLKPGIQIVLDALNFAELISDADLVITGEGRIDCQTIKGKTPIGVAQMAQKFNIPTIAFAGIVQEGHESIYQHGINASFSIINDVTKLECALKQAEQNIKITARNVAALWKIANKSK